MQVCQQEGSFYREPTEITDYTCPTSDKHFITVAKPSFPLIKGLQFRSKLYKLIFLHTITLPRNTVSILFSIQYTIQFSNYNPSIIEPIIHFLTCILSLNDNDLIYLYLEFKKNHQLFVLFCQLSTQHKTSSPT